MGPIHPHKFFSIELIKKDIFDQFLKFFLANYRIEYFIKPHKNIYVVEFSTMMQKFQVKNN